MNCGLPYSCNLRHSLLDIRYSPLIGAQGCHPREACPCENGQRGPLSIIN
ncbi:hypothetical protein ES703_68015 [subsurface metagenome]